jgi:hypothetical protein
MIEDDCKNRKEELKGILLLSDYSNGIENLLRDVA